ncbi:MAG: hypothetical protein A3I05_00440 [Deltaproteobacteria bacterium RIFCSPLOWO2_02_FULL_44_10]|nr:MAG: hypothetical protein A3C46_01310 [Deltaproteobacteria bacterium RIFCSPHIGHO2_02_FULL_44_16]OGQ47273.1 MAG: hypothetical protein A3I05_00440 [Deltaproteobacteria bacterium RIFCSPLOWO2_02_FULL_44_10]
MQQRKALGRGIASLIPPEIVAEEPKEQLGYRKISIDLIIPNRLQPRTLFDEEKIRELAESIKEEGILQPLVVSPLPDGRYELIAGERRFRAAREAGLEDVPVVVKSVDQESLLVLSILENIQREDLNALEEARAFQELVDQFGYAQDDIARRMGRSRTAVANSLRLLKLPRAIQEDVIAGRYTAGHARALLSLQSIHEQLQMREVLIKTLPTVRDVERMVQEKGGAQKQEKKTISLSPQVMALAEKMKQALGTKVMIQAGRKKGGRVVIEYYSAQDLDRIVQRLNV